MDRVIAYFIRHTSTAPAPDICYGRSDVALADSYPREREAVRERLRGLTLREPYFYSSPLGRCRRLALDLAGDFASQVHYDERLQELDFGAWELQSWNAIDREQSQRWMDDYTNVPCPGGESYRQLHARVTAFWESLGELHSAAGAGAENPDRSEPEIVVVAHAGSIRSVVAHVTGIPLERSFSIEIERGRVSAVQSGGGVDSGQRARLLFLNR
jgi:alpha-ribazole phosphatase